MALIETIANRQQATGGRRRIAVVGAGISGLSAAWLLSQHHRVTLFEANDYPGGHSHTVDVDIDRKTFPVDTGFIVYNPVNYPNLTALFRLLDVPTASSNMSFSVSLDQGRFEYAGGTPFGLMAQPANLVRPAFWQMLAGIARFYRRSRRYTLDTALADMTLGELLAQQGYSPAFILYHLAPMGAAIWSSDRDSILDFPARSFMRFLDNHGLTRFVGRPAWRTVTGGSRGYVERITDSFRDCIRLSLPVKKISHAHQGVTLHFHDRSSMAFDQVVLACHADQALALIEGPSAAQREALGAFEYRNNPVVLHADPAQMPKRRLAWASWNFIEGEGNTCMVSYWMNRLQPLPVDTPVIVTLNPQRDINPAFILGEFDYAHPVMNQRALQARQSVWRLQGKGNLWFCGAWLGDGFHEDGIQSGLAVAELLGGEPRPWQLPGQNGRIGLADTIIASAGLNV